ncbi:tetratricopeptide repeat-containing sensor histidine kinase [Sediminicola sp. 1XM1-17]|uniref:tetratricopeptide repeat-containing sensor histidine kinase n=1 Tax=Sediminicola sp. 1XM1-17 TaxID=3127702 RepID=UPI003078055F
MMKHLFFPLFLLLCIVAITAAPTQNLYQNQSFDSSKSDSLRLAEIKSTIKNHVKKAEYDSVVLYSKKMLRLSQKMADSIQMAESYFYLGYYLQIQFKSDEAYEFYNEAFKIDVLLGDYEAAADMLNAMANIQKGLGDYIGGQITAVEGLDYLEKTTNYHVTAALQHVISVCAKEMGDYDDALLWNKKAIQLAKNHPDQISSASLLVYENTRANILVKYKKYAEAIALYSSLLEAADPTNAREGARIKDNLAFTSWLSDQENTETEQNLLDALNIRLDLNDLSGLISSYIHLTQFYLESDKAKALLYSESAYAIALEKKNPIAAMEALDYIIGLKHDLGKNATSEALAYSEIRNGLEQSKQKIRRIYASTKYDNDKLNKDVLLLKTQTAEKEKQNILYLSSFMLVLMGSSFVFILLRRNHRIEKIQESYKTETRISKKVHDELANDVYRVMTQLQLGKNDSKVLDDMEYIYNRTRNISKENHSIFTDKRFPTDLKGMLGSYISEGTNLYLQGMEDISWTNFSEEKKVTLYRVLQELMTNMKKHSGASLVALTFKKEGKYLWIGYTDNGRGITLDNKKNGSGLLNVENRISSVHGSFTFTSEPGKGFRAELKIPG